MNTKPIRGGAWLILWLALLLLATGSARANNLVIENVVLTGFNATDDYVLVQFDISWENSWRLSVSPSNWDAAWVFVKFKVGGVWRHATLHASGHTVPAGAVIDPSSDGKGVFLYRSADGTGDVNYTNVQLRWDYGVDGLTDNEGNVDIAVLGIEMVYVPEGNFALGSGGSDEFAFYTYPHPTTPYTVSSEAAINVGPTNDNLFYDSAGDKTGPIPEDYPKGYAAFYIMKYEITQGQYAEFLNMLTPAQSPGLFPNEFGANRHTISSDGESPPTYAASAPDRACNWLNWGSGVVYADWAALRPMTELEYEKASRGTRAPVPNEYAWGSTGIHIYPYTIVADGTPNATISDPGSETGNASYPTTNGSLDGPLRVGIFAASFLDPTDPPMRAEAGATFYGVMEMSGNLRERVIWVGNGTARAFTGTHGDGDVATGTGWPGWRGELSWWQLVGLDRMVAGFDSHIGARAFQRRKEKLLRMAGCALGSVREHPTTKNYYYLF